MKSVSLGLIETWGYVPAVEAVDAGMKSADVVFAGYEITKTALVTVKFIGDVAAVTSAVKAGTAAAEKVGRVIATHVIPRPDPQLNIRPPEPIRPLTKTKAPIGIADSSKDEIKTVDADDVKKAKPRAKKKNAEASTKAKTPSDKRHTKPGKTSRGEKP
jgi:ethanolamine utilization protein EutM